MILDRFGTPIVREALAEPQTAKLAQLQREFATHPTRGLTPSKLARILDDAEQGNILAQYEMFLDMEEKDAHILAEMGKRRRALVSLEWSIEPPRNANAAEKKAAEQLAELVQEVPDFEGFLFDVTDAIGKGFCNVEIEWSNNGGEWLPASLTHRPQTWFQLERGYRQEIRLRDNTATGAALNPFGWVSHVHRASSGYIERAALFRALVWPYLFKNYSVGDLAEFLEIYGIPMRIGTYPPNAKEEDKVTLLRALARIGHDAAGIIPAGMEIKFEKAAEGDPDAFTAMIDWCERSESKAILGGTLTSQADGKSSTNALGNVHNEVRKDLRDGDAKQIAATITRDLLYPLAALNLTGVDTLRRCPRFVFDVREPEDLKLYADALPALVKVGAQIPEAWAREKLRIPAPAEGERVLAAQAEMAAPTATPVKAALRRDALRMQAAATQADDFADEIVQKLADHAAAPTAAWLDKAYALVEGASSYDELLDRLAKLQTDRSTDDLAALIQGALAAARLGGRADT